MVLAPLDLPLIVQDAPGSPDQTFGDGGKVVIPVAVVLGRMPVARFFPEAPPPPEVSGEPPDLPPRALRSTDPEVD